MEWISFKDNYPKNEDLENFEDEYICLIHTKSNEWFPRSVKDVDEFKNDVTSGYYTHWLLVKAPNLNRITND